MKRATLLVFMGTLLTVLGTPAQKANKTTDAPITEAGPIGTFKWLNGAGVEWIVTSLEESTVSFVTNGKDGIPYRVKTEQTKVQVETMHRPDGSAIAFDKGFLILLCVGSSDATDLSGRKDWPTCEHLHAGLQYRIGFMNDVGRYGKMNTVWLLHGDIISTYQPLEYCFTSPGPSQGHCKYVTESVDNYDYYLKGTPLQKLKSEAPWPQ
jgi:hypothetical protein